MYELLLQEYKEALKIARDAEDALGFEWVNHNGEESYRLAKYDYNQAVIQVNNIVDKLNKLKEGK